jgi:predicted CXXCH cytochrome family protein
MDKNSRYLALFALCLLFVLSGCDPVTRYKVMSTIFDGVPRLPPPEQLCEEYAAKKVTEFRTELTRKAEAKGTDADMRSNHLPYEEKKCDNCHDKNKEDGLVAPKSKVCFVCHTGFLTGAYLHGPAAVGACLSCHEPHSALFPKLLKNYGDKLCEQCHRETRVATDLHSKVRGLGMACTDCHDPHGGSSPYFLR